MVARLKVAAPTPAKRNQALAVLWEVMGHLGWESHECAKSAADLCEAMRMKPPQMARTLQLLEDVGAIRRIRRGSTKVITVTPEGAFRGNVRNHAQAVERYRRAMIEAGKADG